MSAQARIVIAAGGTAGHVVPALAVAEALRARGAGVTFIGGERAEAQLVPQAGFELRTIRVEGLSRTNPLRAARALSLAALACARARKLLAELAPAAVMGGGGYVAGPVGAAALSRRIPLVLTEADSHLGLSNRVLARGARAVCLAFPIDDRDPPRYRVTGRPVPAVQTDRVTARQAFGIGTSEPCLIVFGGSQGARSLNVASLEAFASQSQLHVLHVCGRRDYPELAAMARSSSYQLLEYLDVERFGEALAAADLALARAGGSIFELAAHGLPALLVPYPHAAGAHQSANARWAAAAGAAIVIEDAALTPALLREQVDALIDDRERLAAMAAAARALARPHAADEIAAELLAAAGTR